MRVLLDESVPRRLKKDMPGYAVMTVPEMGWASIKNGELLELAQESFDVFVTVDRGMRFQQNLSAFDIAVVVIVVRHNKYEFLQPWVPTLVELLDEIQPGTTGYIGRR